MSEKLSKIRQLFYICCLLQMAFIQMLPATWEPPVLVSVPGEDAGSDGPVLDVNASNNGLAVWIAPPGLDMASLANVQSSFYTFGLGWSAPEIISSLAPNPTVPGNRIYLLQADPHGSMNELNYCVAVWEGTQVIPELNNDTILGVFAATRSPAGVWSEVQRMSAFVLSDEQISENPRVAVNDPGLAVAVWNEERGDGTSTRFTVASTLQMGGIWSPPVDISNAYDSSSNMQDTPDVAINNNGEAVAVWHQNSTPPTSSNVFAATYNGNTNTWSPSVQLDTAGFFAASDIPHVAIDANGNAIALWDWTDGLGLNRIYSASFTPGIGWGAPVVVTEASGGTSLDSPYIVMDLAGNSTAIWNFNGLIDTQVFAAKLPLGGTWSTPVPISPVGGFIIRNMLSQRPLSVDLLGNVIAIYTIEDAGVASLYSVANFNQVWQTPEFISSSTAYPMQFRPGDENIGLGSCGFALSLWNASPYEEGPVIGDFFQVWGSENFGPVPVAPCNLQGNRCHERFATSSFYVNRLTWTACGDTPCILSYNIYRDGVLIATVPGNVTFYNDPVCNKRAATYTVTAVSVNGVESLPATVVIQ